MPVGYLAAITFSGVPRPVIRVIDETSGELVYMIRSPSSSFKPPVFSASTYTIEIGNPDNNEWEVLRNRHIILQIHDTKASNEQSLIDKVIQTHGIVALWDFEEEEGHCRLAYDKGDFPFLMPGITAQAVRFRRSFPETALRL